MPSPVRSTVCVTSVKLTGWPSVFGCFFSRGRAVWCGLAGGLPGWLTQLNWSDNQRLHEELHTTSIATEEKISHYWDNWERKLKTVDGHSAEGEEEGHN